MFNLFQQTQKELENFYQNKVLITGGGNKVGAKRVKPLSRNNTDASFSQSETLDLIDLYYNSKFQTGNRDAEGQRKYFLNICKFRADVASKMIDLDTKDFIFVPEDSSSQWPSWFLGKEFKIYAKEHKLAKLINEIIIDVPKYGSAVIKKVGDDIIRVPLRNLKNTQDAESLDKADYVIEKHKITRSELKELAEKNGWDAEDIEVNDKNFDEEITYFERYGMVPENMIDDNGDENKMVRAVTIVTIDEKDKDDKTLTGAILFKDKIKTLPYREVHWSKQDGRWLGIGEIENQFENQLSRNTITNLRRRAMMWSSKKIFQSPDDTVAKNLIKDVKDGQILTISPNGQITQVNQQTQALADFNAAEQIWEQNSNQVSFTFEVGTGEALPSGTPFRLGVILASAVKSHFELKRENVGLFLKEVITELVIPVFRKKNKEHIVTLFADEEGIQDFKSAIIKMHTNKVIKDEVLKNGRFPDVNLIRMKVEEEVNSRKFLFIKVLEDFYDDIKFKTDLVITGESVNIETKLEGYKTILQMLMANPAMLQDPNMRPLINKALAMTGENLDALVGRPVLPQMTAPAGGGGQIPQRSAFAQEESRLTATPGGQQSL